MNKQTGFTLVEIAIVMVIIGLLLGGVLKGQQIIVDAKIKNLDNLFNGTTAAHYTYLDRYQAIAGDHQTATAYFTNVSNGDGDRQIGNAFDASGGEAGSFWQHLRNAGLVAGAPTDATQPSNPFSGIVGFSTGTAPANGQNITVLFVGFSNIPNNIAQIMDTRGDDGVPITGSIQADQNPYVAGDTDTLFRLFFKL